MRVNVLLVYLVVLIYSVKANSDCAGYFECFRSFISNFFNQDHDTIVYKIDNTSNNVSEIKDVNIKEVDRVLKDLSTLLNIGQDGISESHSGLALYKNFDNKTQVYINYFEFDTEVKNVSHKKDIDVVKENTTRIKEVSINDKDNFNNKLEVKDIKQNEITFDNDFNYYEEHDDNTTDYPILDYVDFYRDTTNEEYVYVPTESTLALDNITSVIQGNNIDINILEVNLNSDVEPSNNITSFYNKFQRSESIDSIFPWIVTIFIKNDTENNQLAYYCDGVLLTETKILTAARCVNFSNTILNTEDMLVVLGKSSLQQMADREKVCRINQVIVHENFSNDDDGVKHDLAVLIMDEPVKFTKYIKQANISKEQEFKGIEHSATTAWSITGRLEPVLFEKVEYASCLNDLEMENALCATYGYDVALCPSYGGLFAVKRHNQWQLEGIMSGNPSKRGICFNKSVTYTYLENYLDWIRNVIGI